MSIEEKEALGVITKLPSAKFKNSYGEEFTVHSNGVMVFLSGSEVDDMVEDKHKIARKYVPLFNTHFNIWSADELVGLAEALLKLHGGKKS